MIINRFEMMAVVGRGIMPKSTSRRAPFGCQSTTRMSRCAVIRIGSIIQQHRDFESNLKELLDGKTVCGQQFGAGQPLNLINALLLKPQSAACIAIATEASLKEMVAPGALVGRKRRRKTAANQLAHAFVCFVSFSGDA